MAHRSSWLGALVALACLSFSAAPATPPPQGCGGCSGSGGSSTASGGTCGGLVRVTVTMQSGTCKWAVDEWGIPYCRQIKGCTPTVTRHWEHLTPNTPLKLCLTIGGDELCLDDPLHPITSGPNGSGDDVRESLQMSCSSDPSNARDYSIRSPSCGLEASAQAVCSDCSSV